MRSGRYVFVSHDGFGLGHVRRNVRLAEALRKIEPDAEITIVTGIESRHVWLDESSMTVVRVPSLVKGERGEYRNHALDMQHALSERAEQLLHVIDTNEPDAVIVDRHPLGVGGEWRAGLERARSIGSAIFVGLRDILDEPSVVRAELRSERWSGLSHLIDEILVYGAPVLCDQQLEYGLPVAPTYCGWVGDGAVANTSAVVDDRSLVVAAGGGGDGAEAMAIGCELAAHARVRRATFVLGPAGSDRARAVEARLQSADVEFEILPVVENCARLFASAGSVLSMAGYNSVVEALSVGCRPILMPRRAPRREQAIRACRLASLGLADVIDANAGSDEIAWLLDRPRRIGPDDLVSQGIGLNGAENAARRIRSLIGAMA